MTEILCPSSDANSCSSFQTKGRIRKETKRPLSASVNSEESSLESEPVIKTEAFFKPQRLADAGPVFNFPEFRQGRHNIFLLFDARPHTEVPHSHPAVKPGCAYFQIQEK